MPFTMIAWQESQDEGAALLNEAAAIDTHVTAVGDIIYVPARFNKLIGAYVYGGTTATAARLRSPSMRAMAEYQINPIDITITPSKVGLFQPHPDNPIQLTEGEGLEALLNADPA